MCATRVTIPPLLHLRLSKIFPLIPQAAFLRWLRMIMLLAKRIPVPLGTFGRYLGVPFQAMQQVLYLLTFWFFWSNLAFEGFLNGLPLIETVGPGSIKDEPLSAISDGSSSSINSPAITDCSSPERIHGQSTWNPVSVGPQRKRCLSDCVSSPAINQTRGRSASDAYSTFQTFPGTLYDGFQGPSSYSPIPPPAGHCYQPYPTWSRSHSNPDFPTDLPVQQSAEYDYSSMGLYDGDRQGNFVP